MQEPNLIMNYVAILVAVVACQVFGFLWYGPLVGKTWLRLMKIPTDFKPSSAEMGRSIAMDVLGTLLTVYVLAHDVQVWRPSAWNAGTDAPAYIYGFFAGFFIWLGFYAPTHMSSVAWERRPWALAGINATYTFIKLQMIAQILSHWR